MQAVRCDACGLKALVAASQCPHCGHLLDLRDSFGELLPLSHCTTCDAWYPKRDGACKWCGTQPERVNYRPYIWRGIGALAFAGMAVGAWLTRDVEPQRPVELVALPQDSAAIPAPVVERLPAVPSSAPADAPSLITLDSSSAMTAILEAPNPSSEPQQTEPVPAIDLPSLAAPDAQPAPAVVSERERRPIAKRPPPAPARRAGWRNAVAVSWVTVRAAPSRSARLLGSVGPDTHVQLGESRGAWLRIRMKGLAGWVEHGRFAPRRVASARRTTP